MYSSGEMNGIYHVLLTAAGKFYLLSYWLAAGIWAFPSGFSIPIKKFPEAV
jgi:hypothetical protein